VIPWNAQERTRLTNASIPRSVVLACYENAAALLALAELHRQAAREAERMALGVLRWALAHPELPAELSGHELRRLIAQQTAREAI
jgi:hypothetical protein